MMDGGGLELWYYSKSGGGCDICCVSGSCSDKFCGNSVTGSGY